MNHRAHIFIPCQYRSDRCIDIMHFSKSNCSSLIAFLLITIVREIESLTTETTIQQQDQPFWQTVLRDFVYRTVASPQLDDALYKKLLNAPFYGGPLRESFNDEDVVLSSGNVYRMPGGRWIFCQDDCVKCETCEQKKNSTIKWMLRRVKRWMSQDLPKWDLQLTVLPQLNEEPHERSSSVAGEPKRPARLSGMVQSDWKGQRFRGNDDSILATEKQLEDRLETSGKSRSADFTRVKRYRPKAGAFRRHRPLAFHNSQEDLVRINSNTDRLRDDWTPRLIMGIDQHGEKHLVHVVPIDSPSQEVEHSRDSSSSRGSHQTVSSPRISRTIQKNQDETAYENLIDRIFDSLNNHKNIIETFLFSDRLEPETRNEAVMSPYSSYTGQIKENERFEDRNEPDYRSLSPPGTDRYPVNSEYQTGEQDETYGRYADMSQEVNRPERSKQIDDYEPYGMSANDRRQDERSLPQAEYERRRRDYFGKLTDSSSTFGHQGLDEYHTPRDTTDSGFSIDRKIFRNFTDQTVENPRLEINQSEPRIENFPVESATIKTSTDGSDDSR